MRNKEEERERWWRVGGERERGGGREEGFFVEKCVFWTLQFILERFF